LQVHKGQDLLLEPPLLAGFSTFDLWLRRGALAVCKSLAQCCDCRYCRDTALLLLLHC
jgi:hypothetical protein